MTIGLNAAEVINGKADTGAEVTYIVNGMLYVTATGVSTFETLAQGQLGSSSGALGAAVSAGNQWVVKQIFLVNTDAVNAHTVTLYMNGTTAAYEMTSFVIPAGGSAQYDDDGWSVYNSSGVLQMGMTGACGVSGTAGACGISGVSGVAGACGVSGISGVSGTAGACGVSGVGWPPAVDVLVATSGGAVTIPITYPMVKVTNYSTPASTVTFTMTTSGAVDGQTVIVRFYDSTAASKTLAWVNTEVGAATPPTASKGSTTIPTTIGFIFNGVTSLWSCAGEG
jgi:hypothetical protein